MNFGLASLSFNVVDGEFSLGYFNTLVALSESFDFIAHSGSLQHFFLIAVVNFLENLVFD